MTDSRLQKTKAELAKGFRSSVMNLQRLLKENSDNENVIAGTEDKPIVSDNPAIPIYHHFMDGVYVRGMKMSKGQAVIGHIHKHLHMCFLVTGEVTVVDESGENYYLAPCIIESTPGVKRVLYAHQESLWYNTHKNPTNTKDLEKLERSIVAISYEEYEEYTKHK